MDINNNDEDFNWYDEDLDWCKNDTYIICEHHKFINNNLDECDTLKLAQLIATELDNNWEEAFDVYLERSAYTDKEFRTLQKEYMHNEAIHISMLDSIYDAGFPLTEEQNIQRTPNLWVK